MAFSSKGDLFVATGDQGEIHRVTPAGAGSVFFKTEETHARSLAIDAQDNLIVGTEPSGLILRISPAGQGFVLYQSPKREITAVAVKPDGSIYAAGVGNKTAVAQAAATTRYRSPRLRTGGAPNAGNGRAPAVGTPGPSLVGGSEVYRIEPDGAPRKIWAARRISCTLSDSMRPVLPLLGTGNRGKIYRLDSDSLSTLLLDATPTQVTGFGRSPQGRICTPLPAISAKYFASVLASRRAGRLKAKCWTPVRSPIGAASTIAAPARSRSPRAAEIAAIRRVTGAPGRRCSRTPPPPACDSCGAGRAVSPSARFLQYKIDLTPASGQPAPEVSYVEVAYLPKNVAPVVETIDITPANYRFPAPVLNLHSVHLHHAAAHRPAKEHSHAVRRDRHLPDHELRERLRRRALAGDRMRTTTRWSIAWKSAA